MKLLIELMLVISVVCLTVMLIGLYKPWVTLWWEATQNRKKVIKVYGTAALLFFLLYHVLLYLYQSTKA